MGELTAHSNSLTAFNDTNRYYQAAKYSHFIE